MSEKEPLDVRERKRRKKCNPEYIEKYKEILVQKECTEDLLSTLREQGYKVHRIPGDKDDPDKITVPRDAVTEQVDKAIQAWLNEGVEIESPDDSTE